MNTEKRRTRGTGCVFRMPGSPWWWIAYSVGERRVRESSKSTRERDAEKLLRTRLSAVDAGTFSGPEAERVTFEDLAAGLRRRYELEGRRSIRRLTPALAHLGRFFGGWKALRINTAAVERYHAQRMGEGAAPASVHYEIAVLKRAISVARRNGLVSQRLDYSLPALNNARRGFFERADFEALRAELSEPLRPVVTFAYFTGWRVPSEVLKLEWSQVDFSAGVVRLEPGTTKNADGRVFPFDAIPELVEVLRYQREATDEVQRRTGAVVRAVFHREGRPIRDFRAAWQGACKRAALVGRIRHDFRRTAVRNLVRAGVPEQTAMKLTGHKTRAVFDRYDIVNEADLRAGAVKLAALHAGQPEPRTVLPLRRTGTDGAR